MPPKKTVEIEVPAVNAPVAPDAPILHGYEDRGQGYGLARLLAIDESDQGTYRVAAPLPQDVVNGGITYDISDRAAGLYRQRGR